VNDFDVYAYYEPDVDPEYGLPFYVGKGRGRRAYDHLRTCSRQQNDSYNTFFYRKLRKMRTKGIEPEIEIVMDNLTEVDAIMFERQMIHVVGRRNLRRGPLCNLTDGGDGASGRVVSQATRAKIAAANTGHVATEETRQKLRERRGWKHSEESRQRLSAALRGQRRTAETCQRIGASKRGFKHSEATRQRMSELHVKRRVAGFDEQGMCVCEFKAIKDAADAGYMRSNRSNCLAGRQKTHRGLTWRYTDA
jgi:hypothetical protein